MRRFAILFVVILLGLFAFELTPPGQQLVQPWTDLVARASTVVIRAFDGDAQSVGKMVYSTRTGFAMTIEAGCNGVEAAIVLVAAMLAFPAPWRYRAIGIAIGIAAVQVLNIVRVISLFYIGQWDFAVFEWAHQYVWQALIMLDVLVVWLIWVRRVPMTSDAAPPAPPALAAG